MYSKLQDGSFIVCGYVARDSELKTAGEKNSSLCKWSVKVGEKIIKSEEKGEEKGDKKEQKEPIWVNCQAWHNTARVASAIKKGDTVLCVGKLETNEYEGKTYKNLNCEFISIMNRVQENQPPANQNSGTNVDPYAEYEEILGDGDVPF